MKIKPMLARLQSALGDDRLLEQMLLLPGHPSIYASSKTSKINLVIGYNGSPNSQVALDLILWIAHQTRLATQKDVMVHVVYVIEGATASTHSTHKKGTKHKRVHAAQEERSHAAKGSRSMAIAHPEPAIDLKTDKAQDLEKCLNLCHLELPASDNRLEQADCVLWQARCLAEEWRGSLEAHLRFGSVADELCKVVESESADLLFVGCSSTKHSVVKQLGLNCPCPVLGIPAHLEQK